MSKYDYDFFVKQSDYVKSVINDKPDVGIILGTGLGDFYKKLENRIEIPYSDIPGFPVSTAPGHAGKLIYGKLGEKKVLCMAGRFHRYEGYDFEVLTMPIRLFKLLGVGYTILTNASGCVNPNWNTGEVMIISDHIKLSSQSPLIGKNIPEFGPRFFDVSDMYTQKLRDKAKEFTRDSGIVFHEGVYMYFAGPQFETAAEIRAAGILGADAIGMSTVTEALTAAHCKMPLLAFSVLTNMATGVKTKAVDHEGVEKVAADIMNDFGNYVETLINNITEEDYKES